MDANIFSRINHNVERTPTPFPNFYDQPKSIGFRSRDNELTLWVEQCGSGEVGGNVRGTLATISKNEKFINMTLAVLITPKWVDLEFRRLDDSRRTPHCIRQRSRHGKPNWSPSIF